MSEGNKPLGRHWRGREDNIKISLREIVWMVWIGFAWFWIGDLWQAVASLASRVENRMAKGKEGYV
jgi:cell division protein FtsB